MTTRIHDLLDLAATVRKDDFGQGLTGGIVHPEHALSIIGSALREGRSQAAYLHGSFGADKRHSMALLDLMLTDHPAPWSRGELPPCAVRGDGSRIVSTGTATQPRRPEMRFE